MIQISFKKIVYKIPNRLPQIDRQQMDACIVYRYIEAIDSEGEEGVGTAKVARSVAVAQGEAQTLSQLSLARLILPPPSAFASASVHSVASLP